MTVRSRRSFSTSHSFLLIGTATIALSAMPGRAIAATQTISADTTIAAPITGDAAAPQAADLPGNDGGMGVIYNDPTITIINNSTITGGTGSDGGPATGLGNAGGWGGYGVDFNDQFGASTSSHITLINNGTIIGGAGADGSDAAAASGFLGGDGGGGGIGVYTSSADYAVIINHGFIYDGAAGVAGASDGLAPPANAGSDGIALYVSGSNNVHIINDETISSGGIALQLVASSDLVIDNAGGVITSSGATTLYEHFDSAGFTLNGGTVINTWADDNAEAISIDSSQSGPVTSSATIIADGSGTALGVAFDFNNAQFAFDNFGAIRGQIIGFNSSQTVTNEDGASITGDINLGASADIFFINGGTVTGDIFMGTGNDDIHINGGVVMGDISAGGNGDTLELNGGRVVGDIDMGTGVDTLLVEKDYTTEGGINSGGGIELEVLNNKTFTLNHVVNIGGGLLDIDSGAHMDVAGPYFFTGSNIDNIGTLTIGANSTVYLGGITPDTGTWVFKVTDDTHFGKVDVSGDAVNLQSATVEINVENAAQLTDGAQMLIGTGVAQVVGLDGNPGQAFTTAQDNSYLFSFQIADGSQAGITAGGADNTQLYLLADRAALASVVNNSNSGPLAKVLDDLSGSSDPDIQAIENAIAAAPTAEALEDILESLRPAVDGAMTSSLAISAQAANLIGAHLSAALGNETIVANDAPTGISAGDSYSSGDGRQIWAQSFGAIVDQNERDGIAGYDSKGGGIALGADIIKTDNTLVGLSFSYAATNIDSDNVNDSHTHIDTYQGEVYGAYAPTKNAFINGMAFYGLNNNTIERNVLGNKVSGDFNADQYGARVEAGRHFMLGNMTLTPSMLVDWTHYSSDDYKETGTGGLTVSGDDEDIAETGAGLKAGWKFTKPSGLILSPSLHAGVRYQFLGDRLETTARFTGGGPAFTSPGADPARLTANIGAGLDIQASERFVFSFVYDFEAKEDYAAHAGMIRIGYKF